jgi:hypothetical protein
MKMILAWVQILLLAILISSCESPKNNAETQDVSTQDNQSSESAAEQSQLGSTQQVTQQTESSSGISQPNQNSTVVRKQNAHAGHEKSEVYNKGDKKMLGSEIINSLLDKLNFRLDFSDEQYKAVGKILTQVYLEEGNTLSHSYEFDDARKLGKEIRNRSFVPISAVLNDDQKEQFNQLINR